MHPAIAIGLELRQPGHTVSFSTSASYRPRIESLGFEFRPMRPDVAVENASMAQLVREIMDARKGAERLLRGFIFPQLRATYKDLMQATPGNGGADLLVSGKLVYAAPLVAEKTGVRWASYITSPMSFFSAYDPPVLPPFPGFARLLCLLGLTFNRTAIRAVKLVTRSWSEPVLQLRAELGLPPGKDPIYEGKHSTQLVPALVSSVLAQAQPDWPSSAVVTGFLFYDGGIEGKPLPRELEIFLAAGEPPIVFTLGSAAVLDPGNFYQESAEAARLLKRRAVLLVGQNIPPAPLPENVVAFDYVPFSELFAKAAAIVHQGGIGTTGQALRAGRPMLVMPYNFDQPDNTARLARLSVGRTISRKTYSARSAARELTELLNDPRYARTSAEVAQRLRGEQGAVAAAYALERLLQR